MILITEIKFLFFILSFYKNLKLLRHHLDCILHINDFLNQIILVMRP